MYFAGVDIGSTTSKCIIIDEEENILTYELIYTTFDRNASGEEVFQAALKSANLEESDIKFILSTGYGRSAFLKANKEMPEIIAHAIGTVVMVPGCRTIIDIGGQDSKIIELDEFGTINKFEMNDKCAAGTGRFFEVLTQRLLSVEMDELSDLIRAADDPPTISSMCTIFAESEIISYLSQGKSKENIVAGVSMSMLKRVLQMGRTAQIPFKEKIVFSGGVGKNEAIVDMASELLGKKVEVLENPQSTGAYGAALLAKKEFMKA